MAKLTKGWPHNSELYMTFREVRREIPKFNFPVPFRVVKPIKPNGHQTSKK